MKKALSSSGDIVEFSTLESKCVYLSNERMKMEYKYIKYCSEKLSSDLIKRGWRRFGDYYSRPNCDACDKCLSLRIDVEKFNFSKSVRKVLAKNRDTKMILRKPSVSVEHLNLYEKYHRYMQIKKGWDYYSVNADSYHDLYAKGFSTFGREILYIRDSKLVGVDLVDFLDDGLSAIYFYYDPDFSKYSLGNYSIYKQIEMAKERELKWIYLGYYVKECDSLNYKINYKPYQILRNNPDLSEVAVWS
jgi:arginine-tRNA-protein transferase